ncbi:MAG: glycosyltransferase [Planctomycetia bacterium]|nr:glycosyltransferase [Planctomycetia bacterium]
MKKIGLYLDSVITGGTFQYNLSILEAFRSLPTDQFKTVITYSSDLWESYLHKENISAIKINRTMLSRLWFQIRTPLWLWRNTGKYFDTFSKSFVNQKCDLWVFPSQDIWSYSLSVPTLGTTHDLMHRYERQFSESGSRKEYRVREKHYSRMCNKSEGVLVDSKLGKQQLVESYHIPNSKVHVLPFVAPKYIYETTKSIPLIYNLPPKYLFYPAQFWEHKNHKALVRAVSLLIAKLPELKMVFVGSPNNGYDSLIKLIKKLGLQKVFTFLDQVPDEQMRGLYSKACALIMPTYFGPTNIPPLEAFACGCPVAVSNVYAIPEQVGDAGLLFNPNSDTEISDTIYNLWTDDELIKKLIEKGYQKSKDWEQKHFNKRLLEIIMITIGEN